ncbi:MAG: adenosylmethionine--8-amino-7-oxononanoate transaminase [Candidatus Omnitrophica bacterium]|nr:adenosylmethionine--8-amino-7-oxononanoate transaminase [Candidatus Omnitrophota bacterium]
MTSKLALYNSASLTDLDKKYLWHPFTQMKDWMKEDILVIERGEGVYLVDTEGRRYIDGVSSLWCNVHGHGVEEIDEAIKDQLAKVAHSTMLGLSNVPVILLAQKLVEITPPALHKVFYSDSGSESVEIALKIAYQYWQHKGERKRTKFIHLAESYHGDTLGSVSVGGIELFHDLFRPLLFETIAAPTPYCYRCPFNLKRGDCGTKCLAELESILKRHRDTVAAVVMEPMMQGAAGMIDQPAQFMSRARELTQSYGTLLIFDEVATGFGRTGRMFASDHEAISPDIMCLAKGITGGYLPMAATLTTDEIFNAFLGEHHEFRAFFHGHTYTGNPLAARAALANLELFEKNHIIDSLRPKIGILSNRLNDFYSLSRVGDIRHVGFMVGIELVRDKKTKEPYSPKDKIGIRVIKRAREKGVIIRPLGNIIVLMPPLAIDEKTLERLIDVTYESIKEAT